MTRYSVPHFVRKRCAFAVYRSALKVMDVECLGFEFRGSVEFVSDSLDT